ncbi:asparagine synthase (glutamine-hydrolyzing) [Roseivirga misakiensis]|uniref:asparagine synthase (glutamine-hydrolyzing) n=1 Tax=Roseivirga misakiensis TaxID=1563681 RepID=A0A1E5T1H5_9BACT|nr:asparagine synthase (glutamine-hydrolyzing) [Roseivirga misakiensis]OEK05224.1 asparagine synthase (glutamine-hydrolyzing) [Roseivirga misakiensis]
MCGLAGIFNLHQKPVSDGLLKKMGEKLAHRGPDGEGLYVDRNIGLVHKRLAILDVSERGVQPMSSKDGRYTLVFNGCIYNYIKLRQELRSCGHVFHSDTDTEVIVEGISCFGIDYIKRLNGMFAISCWDSTEERLFLARDRFGIKPLYYWFNGKTIVFASETKAILEHPDYQIGVNLGALNEYFTFQNLFSFRTLFQDIAMLPPANTLVVDKHMKKITHNSWWDYDFSKPDESITFEDAKLETERLMERAVAKQMVSDVPVGSYLSGGMDSGTITAIATNYVPRISTFTCGFDMSEVTGYEANYDERRDAELMANHFKTEHFEQVINAGDLRWSLPKLVYHLEDLRVGMSYPNYYIARLASKFVKVCLQGTGGDELFGGYPWRYYRIFDSLSQQNFFDQYYSFWQRLVPDDSKTELFQTSALRQMSLEEPRTVFERVFTFNDQLGYKTPEQHIQNSLYFEAKTFLPGLFLVGDKLAMANGLEERFPFMDNDLVDFAQKVPVRYKLGNLQREIDKIDENVSKKMQYRSFDDGKKILREAMKGYIPKKIIDRKKQGFSAPDESWYRGENASYVRELLLNKKDTISAEFIKPAYIEKIVREHTEQQINHRLLIWSFMNFEWWCRIFLNGHKV